MACASPFSTRVPTSTNVAVRRANLAGDLTRSQPETFAVRCDAEIQLFFPRSEPVIYVKQIMIYYDILKRQGIEYKEVQASLIE